MIDKAHKLTDAMLKRMEKDLRKMYSNEFLSIKQEIKEILASMDLSNDLTPIERYTQAIRYDRLKKLSEKITLLLNNTNKEAIKLVNKDLNDIYKVNYNSGIDEIAVLLAVTIPKRYEETPTNTDIKKELMQNPNPLNDIAIDNVKDVADLRSRVSRQFISGIMLGEKPNDIIKRIQKVTEAKLSDITRIARTQTTRLENLARTDAYHVGETMGHIITKQWVAVGDNKTRLAHKHANGQQVPLDSKFNVGGEELSYPGDPNGSAENIINCRCTMRAGTLKRVKK